MAVCENVFVQKWAPLCPCALLVPVLVPRAAVPCAGYIFGGWPFLVPALCRLVAGDPCADEWVTVLVRSLVRPILPSFWVRAGGSLCTSLCRPCARRIFTTRARHQEG